MKELFHITPNTTGPGFHMSLKTGEIDVPDACGGYIISSGMGSGKTESIKSLIRQKYDEGILYCVDTKEELGKMFRWIQEELVNDSSCSLGSGDVMIVSSDPLWADYLSQYRDNPEILTRKKVILITHVRFWTDLINYFLIYKPTQNVGAFDGDFKNLMTRDDLRKYIIFDETPTFIKPFIEFDKTLLGVFATTDASGNIVCKTADELSRYYDKFIKGTASDFFKGNFKINRIKRDVVLKLIPSYYDSWLLSGKEKAGITFYPVDLCPKDVKIRNHILIFEGAGNILFKDPLCFRILDVEKKYNTVTLFKKLKFGILRKQDNPKLFSAFINRIARLVKKPTLVVCWKDIEGKEDKSGISEYANRMRNALLKKKVDPSLFTVTYYGATDNKSTNSYKDIEQIILCGDWTLPNTESARIRIAYGTSTDSQDQKDWYFSQLITRIGIRKHIEGETYTVYYTDDFDGKFIGRMDAYFNDNRLTRKKSGKKQEDWKKKLEGMKIRNNIKKEIISLTRYDQHMQEAIIHEQEYTKEVTFSYLNQLGITRGKQERGRYKALVETLKKLKVSLVIKSAKEYRAEHQDESLG